MRFTARNSLDQRIVVVARSVFVCVLGAIAVACTAITGADELTVDEHGQAVGQAEPEEKPGKTGGARMGGTDAGSSSGSTSGGTGSSGSTQNPNTPPPSTPPPASPDAGTTQQTTSIGCGPVTCTGATPVCCAIVGGYQCIPSGTACTGTAYRLTCDSTEDCQTGDVCCAIFGPNEGARCVPAATCKGPAAQYARMCSSDAQCSPGQTCRGFIIDDAGNKLALSSALCSN